jgi:hypothetical protein
MNRIRVSIAILALNVLLFAPDALLFAQLNSSSLRRQHQGFNGGTNGGGLPGPAVPTPP